MSGISDKRFNPRMHMRKADEAIVIARMLPQPGVGQMTIMTARDFNLRTATWCGGEQELGDIGITVYTDRGEELAEPGDWIVMPQYGKRYPVKRELFDVEYVEIESQLADAA